MSARIAKLVPYRLSICGLHELDGFCAGDVSHVVSILDSGHGQVEVFERFGPHLREDFRFDDVVEELPGRLLPSEAEVVRLLRFGDRLAADGADHLLVHCFMGISRSTAAAAILLTQHNPGREAEVFAALDDIRPRNWPNRTMIGHADRLLGRDGALFSAMIDQHRSVTRRYPDMADLIRSVGRGHEVPID